MNFSFPPQLDGYYFFVLFFQGAATTDGVRDLYSKRHGGVKSLGGMGVVLTRRTNKCFLTIHLFLFWVVLFSFFPFAVAFLLAVLPFVSARPISPLLPPRWRGISKDIQGGVYYTQVEDVRSSRCCSHLAIYYNYTRAKSCRFRSILYMRTRFFFLLVFSRWPPLILPHITLRGWSRKCIIKSLRVDFLLFSNIAPVTRVLHSLPVGWWPFLLGECFVFWV